MELFEFFSNLPISEITPRVYKLIYYLQTIKMDVLVSASRTAQILLWSDNAHFFLKQYIKCDVYQVTQAVVLLFLLQFLVFWKLRICKSEFSKWCVKSGFLDGRIG